MRKILCLLLAALLLTGCAPSAAVEESISAATEQTTVPVPTNPPDPMELLLDSMSLKEKVGQLFIVGPEQLTGNGTVTDMTPELSRALEAYPVGGILLFAANILSPEQITRLNRELQEASALPLFLAVDEEGGRVARLAKNPAFQLPSYKSAAAVGASGNPEDALEMGRTIGGYLKQFDFNLDFAPVADVNTNPNNPIIGNRAFSADPAVAAQMSAAFAAGLGEQGILATFKHFPGHGDTNQDSHTGLAVSYRTREELESCEWLPFREATGRDLVMTAHVALPGLTGDMTPATLSREIVTGILREELGFAGLIITDAMNMGAIVESYGSAEAAIAALEAGCDILLVPHNLPEAFEAVIAAVEDGRLSEQWLDSTVRRILEFKAAQGLLCEFTQGD